MLLTDALATSLASVLFFWAIAYFALLKPQKIKVSAGMALAHIAAIDVIAAIAAVALPKTPAGLAVAAVMSAVSCLILRKKGTTAE